jgi:hypothetical protein
MLALLKSTGAWAVLALAGFASGYGTDATAQREETPAAVLAPCPDVRTPLGPGPLERSSFSESGDARSEAAAAALSGGTGLGGEISRPLPAL